MMLIIENASHSCTFVDREHVRCRETNIIVFERKSTLHAFRQPIPGCAPSLAAVRAISIGPAHMDDNNSFRTAFHKVEYLGLGFEVRYRLLRKLFVLAVQHYVLGWMKRQSKVLCAGNSSDSR